MMEIDKYTAYSVISQSENRKINELQKIFILCDYLLTIRTAKQAKEYIMQAYRIKDAVKEFPLGANSFLEVKENSKKYSLRISFKENNEDKCKIFNYIK